MATSVGVNVTGRLRVGCHEKVLGLAGGVHGNWVREVHQCDSKGESYEPLKYPALSSFS